MSNYYEDMVKDFYDLAKEDTEGAFSTLIKYLDEKSKDTYDKHIIPYLACRALIYKGEKGINALISLVDRIGGAIYPSAIIESLWLASTGHLSTLPVSNLLKDFHFDISEDIQKISKDAFVNFVLKSHKDPESFDRLITFLYLHNVKTAFDEEKHKQFHKSIFSILADTSINISMDMIKCFQRLIDEEQHEEKYQEYIKQNPVFIDPLSSDVVDKHRFGSDLIVDFVIETLRGEYILVEIEKPQDEIFTSSNDFTSKFSHAFGQVIDFINWVEENIAYAERKLPGISSPKGLLIMGRSIGMSDIQVRKLRRFNRNSNSIIVLTYDDIITKAKSLYSNIRRRVDFEVVSK